MKIQRQILPLLRRDLGAGKVLILYGPRQVGKTTVVKELIKDIPNAAYFLCDEPDIRRDLTNKTSTELKAFIGNATTIVFDEAQRVENIGITLKLLHDVYPEITVIATGSSSFDLANKIVEPLTGRNITRILYPVSYAEYASTVGEREAMRALPERLRLGMYPAVLTASDPESELRRIASDNLFKDVFQIEGVRKPIILEQLATFLAYQVGQQVSYNELAQRLEISRGTVLSYVRLLEQAYTIYKLPALGRNKRNEVTRFDKIYFYDTGVRNALIGAFDAIAARADVGTLFENFFIVERRKINEYTETHKKQYFWRTKDGSEIDVVEEEGSRLSAFECKWTSQSASTRAWERAYPDVPVSIVHRENVQEFLRVGI